ncbi:MAG TPA: DoxX family membrane protein, partial [Candidatus Limnocylindria bacterium]|nr:DoxX family membrane protein [Candidatus Limnocylindria bacterium]
MITADLADPAYQAYLLLRNAFTIALILAGADKFLNAMIDWVQYLAPVIPRTVGIPPEIFLRGVGIVEIGLGIFIAFVPRRAA